MTLHFWRSAFHSDCFFFARLFYKECGRRAKECGKLVLIANIIFLHLYPSVRHVTQSWVKEKQALSRMQGCCGGGCRGRQRTAVSRSSLQALQETCCWLSNCRHSCPGSCLLSQKHTPSSPALPHPVELPCILRQHLTLHLCSSVLSSISA